MKFFFFLKTFELRTKIFKKIYLNKQIVISHINSLDSKLLNSGLNYFLKSKGKNFIIKINHKFINYFYIQINSLKTGNFKYINELNSTIKTNNFLQNYLFLLNWYLSFFKFLFNLKSEDSKTNKKLLKKKTLKIVNLNNIKRYKFFFLWTKLSLKNSTIKNFKNNFFIHFGDVFLNFKESKLYRFKINLFKKILSN